MATKIQAMTLANKMGVTVEDDGTYLIADAPDGFVFKSDRLHFYSYDLSQGSMADLWTDLYRGLSYGIAECGVLGCDYCDTMLGAC
jgi:hypothetical protein